MAGILKVDQIKGTGASGNIEIPTGYKLVAADGGAISAPGSVLQQVRTYIPNGDITTTSTSMVEASTACRVSITPKQLNSLIHIDMNCGMVYHAPANWIGGIMYVKVGGGSFAAMPAYNGSTPSTYHLGYQAASAAYAPWSFGGVYIHSSISDELTFSPFIRTGDGNLGRFIHPSSSYSITVTEIAQ